MAEETEPCRVLADGWLGGVFRRAGETVELSPADAMWARLAGLVAPPAAPAPAPARARRRKG